MASIKVKFRHSSLPGAEGTIYYRIIHRRVVRQLSTDCHIYESEWDSFSSSIIVNRSSLNRIEYLRDIQLRICCDVERLKLIIADLNISCLTFTADDIVYRFKNNIERLSTFNFLSNIIAQYYSNGKTRTAETYKALLRSFKVFRNNRDVGLDCLDADFICRYEAYLCERHLAKNTISFYMRVMRAVYNKAVDNGLIMQRYPFKRVFTGNDITLKRALPISVIKRIKMVDLSVSPNLAFARDVFMFSFYTRGMSFVDMAFLRRSDMSHGYITYRRHKTKQLLNIKVETCMTEIINRYSTCDSYYLLPILKSHNDERIEYIRAMRRFNYLLERISERLQLPVKLTSYVARHSWASAARSLNIPLSVISESMGHNSELTTQIYLSTIDTSTIDSANHLILRAVT